MPLMRSELADSMGSHFPNPKVMAKLDYKEPERHYLFPLDYKIILPEPNATVKAPPCITVYHAAYDYGMRFPSHKVI